MLRAWLIVISACAALAFGLGWYKYQRIQAGIAFAAALPERVETVRAFTAQEQLWQPSTRVTGEVVAINAVTLKAELGGAVTAVGFTPGAQVRKGQVLVRLDVREEQAQLAAAQADAQLAALELARAERILAAGVGALEARDRAQARFAAAEASIQRFQARIAKKTLRAPFDAIAGLHELAAGQFLDAGDAVAHLVGVEEQVWIDFTLPQEQAYLAPDVLVDVAPLRNAGRQPANQPPRAPNVQSVPAPTPVPRAQSANQPSSAPAFQSAHGEPSARIRARIIARDSFINENSRNARFRALADNSALGAYPGALVHVTVPLGAPQRTTLVPAEAVRRDAFGAKVFVLHPAQEGVPAAARAEQRSVSLGPQRGGLLVIAGGLAPGERVAASGAFKLRDGVLVNAPAEPPENASDSG